MLLLASTPIIFVKPAGNETAPLLSNADIILVPLIIILLHISSKFLVDP